MSQLLTLTRAARLIGVTRGALQKKIRNGELSTFEGMVTPEDLLRIYPKTRFEDTATLERIEKIKDEAFSTRLRERVMPDAEVLSARLNKLSQEHSRIEALLDKYRAIFEQLQTKLADMDQSSDNKHRSELKSLGGWLQRELKETIKIEFPHQLAVEDNFLRLMAAHVSVRSSGHEFFVEGNDNILDAALRSGLALKYGCSDGSCGLCKALILSGQVKKTRAHSFTLSRDEERIGFALLCSNTAVTDLLIDAPEATGVGDIPQQRIEAGVKSIKRLSDEMMLLRLQTPPSQRMRFLAGQSVTLTLNNNLKSEYPVASCPCDEGSLQFHIQRLAGDAFSDYLFAKLSLDETVDVNGPKGDFILLGDSPNPIIFLAFGTGFAPIKSMIEHAMALEMADTMHLYWVTADEGMHYMRNLCRSWADALDNFHYTPMVAAVEELLPAKAAVAEIRKYEDNLQASIHHIVSDHSDLGEYDVYLAGPESMVTAARNLLIAQGLPKHQVSIGYIR